MTDRVYDRTHTQRIAAFVRGRTDIPRDELMSAFPRIPAHHVSLLTALGFVSAFEKAAQ